MPSFSTHVVTEIQSEREGLQRVLLDSGRRAYVLTALIGPVAVGDDVVVNTTAVDLGLGTGGWDVVHWNLARRDLVLPGAGHVMKLRYTPIQVDTGVVEEVEGYAAPPSLQGLPVVVCALHSQLAGVAAGFAEGAPGCRLAFVMTDTAALPLALSDLVAGLRASGLLAATVSAGQAFGGDYEAVNPFSALDVATGPAAADAVVVGPGPGMVGTGTARGHGALEGAGLVDLTVRAGATAIVALRWSDKDPRQRHRGLSHHSTSVLELAAQPALVPVPRGDPEPAPSIHRVVPVDVPDVVALMARHGLDGVTTMGRPVADDPRFFAYAAAAGLLAASVASRR
ncbi:MAG: DUF3866 family protein [Acidimicrobiales bacterium]